MPTPAPSATAEPPPPEVAAEWAAALDAWEAAYVPAALEILRRSGDEADALGEAGPPDEPRDERGRWVTVYHGTSAADLPSILKRGISGDRAGTHGGWANRGHVYLTSNPQGAAHWAYEAALARQQSGLGKDATEKEYRAASKKPSRAAMVEIRLPASVAERLRSAGTADAAERSLRGAVRPEWISRAWVSKTDNPETVRFRPPHSHPARWRRVKR